MEGKTPPTKDTSRHMLTGHAKEKTKRKTASRKKKQNRRPETAELKNHITALSALTKAP